MPLRRRDVRLMLGMVGVVVLAFVITASRAGAAASNSVVSATVPSASWIDATGCAMGTANVTDFGIVLPGTSNVTSSDCAVKFGSSNDTAMLRTWQQDGAGAAMWLPSNGAADTTFDGDGRASTGFPAVGLARDVAVQPDGKIVAVGRAMVNVWDMAIARFNANGTLDTTFAGDGTTTFDFFASSDDAWGVAIDSQGRIVVAGSAYNGTSDDIAVVRLLPDGTPDNAFSGDGKLTFDIGSDEGRDVAVTAGDSIFIGGGSSNQLLVAKVTSTGVLDTSFAGDGTATMAVGGGAGNGWAIDIQPDGRPVVAGLGNWNAVIARFTSTGAVDTSFSGDGRAELDTGQGSIEELRDVVALPTGGILGVGFTGTADDQALVWKVTAAGANDTTFDGDGFKLFDRTGAADRGEAVALLPDGRITMYAEPSSLVRLTANGAYDSSLDGDGAVILPVSSGPGLTWQADGELAAPTATGGFSVASFASTSVADYGNGVDDWDLPGPNDDMFGACLRSATDGATSGGTAWTAGPGSLCPATDGAYWNAIPAASPGTKIAAAAAPDAQGGATDPTVTLRFGFRTRGDQPAGTYLAPIVFETVAPNT